MRQRLKAAEGIVVIAVIPDPHLSPAVEDQHEHFQEHGGLPLTMREVVVQIGRGRVGYWSDVEEAQDGTYHVAQFDSCHEMLERGVLMAVGGDGGASPEEALCSAIQRAFAHYYEELAEG